MPRKGQVYACFVDFTKFYDTVSHDLLFIKLLEEGITGNFYFLLKNMYNNCKYAVKVHLPTYEDSDAFIKSKANYHTRYRWFRTTFFRSIAGHRQGCNRSPLLVDIYLSDLHEHLEKEHKYAPILHEKSITSIAWADDLLITPLQHDGLQKCIHKLNTLKIGLGRFSEEN